MLGYLCCKRNDAMNKSLLPAVVRAKEGKGKEGYGELAACGWSGGEGRFLYAEHFVDCVGASVGCLHDACVCGWGFSKFVDCKGGRDKVKRVGMLGCEVLVFWLVRSGGVWLVV